MIAGINLKARLKNKAFWVSMISAIVLLAQQLGINIFPSNFANIVNSLLGVLTMLGILVDTSTAGISDKISTTTSEISSTEINTTK